MFRVEALSARHGDALVIQWGSHGDVKTAIIDGGPAGTWKSHLEPHLRSLAPDGGIPHLALAVVSHIDDDHIEGVVRLLYAMHDLKEGGYEPRYQIDRFWHNSLDDLVVSVTGASQDLTANAGSQVSQSQAGVAVAQSINQGRDARNLARYLGLNGNSPFGSTIHSGLSPVDVEGMKISIIGPRQSELEAQWSRWRQAVQKSDAKALAAAYTDPNVFNQASIVLLLEFDGVRVLATGDARGDHLLKGLDEAGHIKGGRLHVDLLKVPHHGSVANAEREFYERVTADHYVISANGSHGHPHREVLDWIVDSRAGERFSLHFTNSITEPWDVIAHLDTRPDRSSFDVNVRSPGEHAIRIDLRTEE